MRNRCVIVIGCAAGLLLAIATSAHANTDSPDTDQIDGNLTAQLVRSIFEVKCTQCHGRQLAKAKADFGYVTDLKRIAETPELVVPSKPDESLLYRLVRDGDMPAKGRKAGSLSDQHKQLIKTWIEIGAPPGDGTSATTGSIHKSNNYSKPAPFLPRTIEFLGNQHPMMVHFPIAMLLGAALAELMFIRTGHSSYDMAGRFCLILGMLAAILAAPLGWAYAAFDSHAGWILTTHRWTGTAVAGWSIVTVILLNRARQSERPQARTGYRLALFLGAVLVSVTGFLGGALVHGLEHLSW